MITPRDILDFWFKEISPEQWFREDAALDATIKTRFEDAWREGRNGALATWEAEAEGALALIVLLDQFPRNMFRGKGEAFSSDAAARGIAERAITGGFDRQVSPEAQHFFYLPLMHAEDIATQERCVALTRERLGEAHFSYPYALRHRDAILKFGSFPARNQALGRQSTDEELPFLAAVPSGF